MRIILQDRYKLLTEGKIQKDLFLREAKKLYPQHILNHFNIDETLGVLKKRRIIHDILNENIECECPNKKFKTGFAKFLTEVKNEYSDKEVKADMKKTSKGVDEMKNKSVDLNDETISNNIPNQAFIVGMYAEKGDEKNEGKTYEQLVDLVVKNLTKDPMYYVKNGQFGIKGFGYKEGNSSKSDKMEPVKFDNNSTVLKSNTKDTLSEKEAKTNMPKKVETMTTTPKSLRGVKKMPMPGKEKIIKLQEGQSLSSLLNENFETKQDLDQLQKDSNETRYSDEVTKAAEFIGKNANNKDEVGNLAITYIKDNNITDSEAISHIIDKAWEIVKNKFSNLKENQLFSTEEKIEALAMNKLFMRELEADDLTKEEAIEFLTDSYNEEDINEFYTEVYGSYKKNKLGKGDKMDKGSWGNYDDEIHYIKYEIDFVPDDASSYERWPEPYRTKALKALEFRKQHFNQMSQDKLDSLAESQIKVGDRISLNKYEDFDHPEGTYKVTWVPSPENEEEEEFGLTGPDGKEYYFPLWFIKQSPGKWTSKYPFETTIPDFTITGDYEGEPEIFKGDDLLEILNQMGELAQDGEDFIRKVEYYVTNENSLSGKDKMNLYNWYEESKYNNINETKDNNDDFDSIVNVNIEQAVKMIKDGATRGEISDELGAWYWNQAQKQIKKEINQKIHKEINENMDPLNTFKKFLLTENTIPNDEKIEIDRPYEYKDNKGNIKKGYNVGNGGDGDGGYLYWMREKQGDKQGKGDNIPKENIIRKLDYITEAKKVPVSKKISEIEKNAATVALESKINAIDEEITRRNNQIKMVDENEDLSELVDKTRMKELQKEVKLLEKQKDKYVKLYEKQTGKKKQEVVTDSEADATEEAPIEEATKDDVDNQKKLNNELANTKKAADELNKASKESGLLEEKQPTEEELTAMKTELESSIDMVSNFEEAVEMYLHNHPEHKEYEITLRQLAEPMF